MYFEVFLEIIVAFLAFFGVFCLVKLVGTVWFGYDNVCVTIEVDSKDTVEHIEDYINEAKNTCLVWGGREIAVLVKNKYRDDELLRKLEGKRIKYYFVE